MTKSERFAMTLSAYIVVIGAVISIFLTRNQSLVVLIICAAAFLLTATYVGYKTAKRGGQIIPSAKSTGRPTSTATSLGFSATRGLGFIVGAIIAAFIETIQCIHDPFIKEHFPEAIKNRKHTLIVVYVLPTIGILVILFMPIVWYWKAVSVIIVTLLASLKETRTSAEYKKITGAYPGGRVPQTGTGFFE